MHELRIASGLHRGATLPLFEQTLTIGAGEDADVVLVDPGMCNVHATLTGGGAASSWLLSAVDGDMYDAESNQRQKVINLAVGDFARLGKVWIVVMPHKTAWVEPPLEPVEMPLHGATDMPASRVQPRGPVRERTSQQGSVKRGSIFIPLTLVTVLSAAAAYAMTARPIDAPSDISSTWKREMPGKFTGTAVADVAATAMSVTAGGETPLAVEGGSVEGNNTAIAMKAAVMPRLEAEDATSRAAEAAKILAAVEATSKLRPEELRKAFRRRLADAELLKRLDLTLTDESWTMQGSLDEEETARFERILKSFVDEHRITFPVNAKVVGPEDMLPFKIRQVITGANASIVTQDGERVYVGDEFRGVRMVAIRGNHLTFAGKQKIEVVW